jgi:Flp pilus assembly CpaE family ATPase
MFLDNIMKDSQLRNTKEFIDFLQKTESVNKKFEEINIVFNKFNSI